MMVLHEGVPVQDHNTLQTVAVHQATVQVAREVPKDHFIWSLCCFLYSNPFCLGLAALIFSVKARDQKVVGDIEGARSYGSTALILNIISTVLFCLFVLIFIITFSVVMSQRSSAYSSSNYHSYSG